MELCSSSYNSMIMLIICIVLSFRCDIFVSYKFEKDVDDDNFDYVFEYDVFWVYITKCYNNKHTYNFFSK